MIVLVPSTWYQAHSQFKFGPADPGCYYGDGIRSAQASKLTQRTIVGPDLPHMLQTPTLHRTGDSVDAPMMG